VVALTWNAVGAIVPSVNVGGVIEATSLSALEAMATGRPVIASRLGGLAEIIDDARTGFLAPQKDHAQFARTMNKILSEPSVARAVGRNARQEVIKRFSKDRWVESVIAVYQGAIDELSNQGARQPVAAPTGSA
jgi:glycosyltransferase involved in cell wall biosynthesis